MLFIISLLLTVMLHMTTNVEALCAGTNEGSTVTLQCPGDKMISSIDWASYGTPTGNCPNYSTSSCHATNTQSIVSNACLNRNKCEFQAINNNFGDPCHGTQKRIRIKFTCATNTCACRVYEHCYFKGATKCIDSDTAYVGDDWNDKISSVWAKSDAYCKLWQHRDFKGSWFIIRNSHEDCLSDNFWSDHTSSIDVTKNILRHQSIPTTQTGGGTPGKMTGMAAGGLFGLSIVVFGVGYQLLKNKGAREKVSGSTQSRSDYEEI